MSITYALNSCFIKTPPIVEIMGEIYPVVKIGSLYWTSTNFKGATGVPYQDNAQFNYKMFKRSELATYVTPNLPSGWRVPTIGDTNALVNAGDIKEILATGEPWYNLGNNNKGMNLLPYRKTNVGGVNRSELFLQNTDSSSNTKISANENGAINSGGYSGYADAYLPTRFCCNV